MPVEGLKSLFDWAAVILLFLTFASGAGVLITGNIINKRQAAQLRQFDSDLTGAKTKLGEQQERAADAEKALKGVEAKAEGFRLAIAQANERASKAQESLALAEHHSAEANAKAEGFRLDIARANERAASANETAERERLARLQLEARLADRVILAVQEQSLKTAFARLKGQTVDVSVLGDTPEISQFSGTIMSRMRQAGVLLNATHPLGGTIARGVLVGVKPDASPEFKQTANELVAILQQSVGGGVALWDFGELIIGGISTGSSDQGATPEGQSPLRIVIGSK